ncbi:hypothetical protein HFN88_23285 [Rhizobium laguerreae]|uniref:hypothetical protein n=1 Tax=Rhizobium laguerreae TaxID=1076926 RepID=UPI001C91BE1E|nr:hypothetical protein [Rhizobium laguerreae]MBY3328509.1 hypothetical protein [Rhizobium laguerreae]MBY3395585.1 hypothetical protein [Rhizobium laguerreae]MBY3494554.1 hypothetical protein [Rhizobium laguerreae]
MEFVRAHPEHNYIVVAHTGDMGNAARRQIIFDPTPNEIVREFLKAGRGDYKRASVISMAR